MIPAAIEQVCVEFRSSAFFAAPRNAVLLGLVVLAYYG